MTNPFPANGCDYLIATYPDEPELKGLAGSSPSVKHVDGGRIIVVGTVAGHVVRSPQLQVALEEAGVRGWNAEVAATLEEALGCTDWDLAVILSPFKQQAAGHCSELSSTARQTGVVDTLVRQGDQVLGVATNSFAIEAVLHHLVPTETTALVQIVGTGATARCAVAAVRRACPSAVVGLAGRTAANVTRMADQLGIVALTAPAAEGAVLTIHATTWGETEDSEQEPLAPDLIGSLQAGDILFDLNNRVSGLQVDALGRGCVVVGGRFMQRLVHIQRAWILRHRLLVHVDERQL